MTFRNNRPCPYIINQPVSVVHPDRCKKMYDGVVTKIIVQSYGYCVQVRPDGETLNNAEVWPLEWVRPKDENKPET